jgi:hypothetical protein
VRCAVVSCVIAEWVQLADTCLFLLASVATCLTFCIAVMSVMLFLHLLAHFLQKCRADWQIQLEQVSS